MLDSEVAPIFLSSNSPLENFKRVGIDLTPYLVGTEGCLSILCLQIKIFSPSFVSIDCNNSPTNLHGEHHDAQKSTKTKSPFIFSSKFSQASYHILKKEVNTISKFFIPLKRYYKSRLLFVTVVLL